MNDRLDRMRGLRVIIGCFTAVRKKPKLNFDDLSQYNKHMDQHHETVGPTFNLYSVLTHEQYFPKIPLTFFSPFYRHFCMDFFLYFTQRCSTCCS
jgi:hypothetical protein